MRTLTPRAIVILGLVLMALSIGTMTLADDADEPDCNVMPWELVNLAEANGYEQISDFYELGLGVWDPPFVYGVDSERGDISSVAFWARKTLDSIDNKDSTYLLIATKGLNHMYFKLQQVLQFWPMGGLSVVRDTTINLHDFGHPDDFNTKGPDTTLSNVNLIRIANETSEDLLIFHDSTWFDYATWDW